MLPIFMHLVMTVRPGRFSGAAYPAYDFPPFYLLAGMHLNPHHMAVQGFVAIAVVDHYVVAIPVGGIAGRYNRAIGRGINGRTLWGGKVEAGMHLNGFIHGVDAVAETGGDT